MVLIRPLRGRGTPVTPQAVIFIAVLPHTDCTILRARGVKLAVGGELDAPDGAMVALHDIDFLAIPIIDASPSARFLANDEPSALEVQTHTGHTVLEMEALQLLRVLAGGKEYHLFTSSDTKNGATVADIGRGAVPRVEESHLARLDLVVEGLFFETLAGVCIVPAQLFASSSNDDELICPDNRLDSVGVELADLERTLVGHVNDSARPVLLRGNILKPRIVLHLQAPDAQDLFVASCSNNVIIVGRKCDAAGNVVVLEDKLHFTAVSVPDLDGKVGGGRSGGGVVGAELGLPGGALVTDESADPISSLAMSEHWVAIC